MMELNNLPKKHHRSSNQCETRQTTDGLLIWSYLYQRPTFYHSNICIGSNVKIRWVGGGKQKEYFGGDSALTALSKQPILSSIKMADTQEGFSILTILKFKQLDRTIEHQEE